VHEVKHDGYRLIVRRDGDTVRLFTRRGYDWSDRYPAIARAAAKLRAMSFTIDGEAAVCGSDGVAVFDALHRRGTVTEALLYAFDLLELDGTDMRPMPLGERKRKLARLVDRRLTAIVLNEHTDEDGATVFRHACKLGLEGIVSKRLTAPYRSGASRDWIKVQKPGQSGDGAGTRAFRPDGTMTGRRFPPPWRADKIRPQPRLGRAGAHVGSGPRLGVPEK
jgi:ATP-dependent DNA ligase